MNNGLDLFYRQGAFMDTFNSNHTFAICAYKENPYLEACIESLLAQSVKSNIIICTSTPNGLIEEMGKKYNIPVFINLGESGIAYDWNFAYEQATTEMVTIVHQDDIYEHTYLEQLLKYKQKHTSIMLIFTDYYEIRNQERVDKNLLLRVKRFLNFPLKFRFFWGSKFIRRIILSFGSSICCPSVTYFRSNLPIPLFDVQYKNSCDYMTFVNLYRRDGAFIYCPQRLLGHRIHPESATTLNISANVRSQEDFDIFCKLWPKPIAKFIFLFYKTSEKLNDQ